MNIKIENKLAKFLIRIADTEVILGQRLAEMCSKGPFLEEDIALSNLGLDLFGRAEELLKIVAHLEGDKHSPDDYVFRRNEREYFCLKIVEQPNHDFAWVIARQYLHDIYTREVFNQLLNHSMIEISSLSNKVLKEIQYSFIHSRDWVLRLGIGTEESNQRIQKAFDILWKYTEEIFNFDDIDKEFLSDTNQIKTIWEEEITKTFSEANLKKPEDKKSHILDYRDGFHSEYLGLILTDMQFLPRAYPNAKW